LNSGCKVVGTNSITGSVTGKIVNISKDEGEDKLPTEDLSFLSFRNSPSKKYPKAGAPGDANITAIDSILEEVVKHLKLGMEGRARAFRVAATRAGVKSFGNGLKIKKFPNWAADGTSGVGIVWPFDKVATLSNRRSSKPGLDQYRGVQVEVVKREIVEEGGGVGMFRHWSLCDIRVISHRNVHGITLTQQVENLRSETNLGSLAV
jgi:hypothetical protein